MIIERTLVIIAICFSIINAKSQGFYLIKSHADSLRELGDLEGAIKAFHEIYLAKPTNKNNLYSYACALSINGQLDSAFGYLSQSIELDTLPAALTEPDFINLRKDKHWIDFENNLIRMIELKQNSMFKDLDYAKKLWRMSAYDQAYYDVLKIARAKTGNNSTVTKAIRDLKAMINERSQVELETLIEEKGWPAISDVGAIAAEAAFLVIQHSDLDKQKKYLPIIKNLCRVNEASWGNYALMYDGIQVSSNLPQKYGSQVRFNKEKNNYELWPLENETKVCEWRMELGLQSFSDYLENWGIKFDCKK